MSGVFVTGTGTEVGKTVVSCVLAHTASEAGVRVSVFKPAVSGIDGSEKPDHERLRHAAGSGQTDDEIAPYRYGPAVSPHLAAEMGGDPVDPRRLRARLYTARAAGEFLVCEGVGGFLVPLSPRYLIRDFAVDAGLPVVVVASPGLGTISHTLLTIEAARTAGLVVGAVVMTPWPPGPTAMEESNRVTIERLGKVQVHTIGVIDPDDPLTWPALSV